MGDFRVRGGVSHIASHLPFIYESSVTESHPPARKAGLYGPVLCPGRKERIDFDNLTTVLQKSFFRTI